MGTQYLMDTNVVIEFLGGKLPHNSNGFLQNIIESNFHHLSVINQIELLGYNGPPSEMKTLEDFIQISIVLPLSETIALNTIKLRKAYNIKLPDAIIAATALTYQLTLITRNTSDFNKIKDLICIDAHNF